MKNYSIWEDFKDDIVLKKINKDITTEALIIGGGISGINILHSLVKAGIKTILVEKNKCGHATTSKSTAKITYLQEKIYMNIRALENNELASLYLESQRKAVNLLVNLIKEYKINCDLEKADSYLFSNNKDNYSNIEEEYIFLKNNQVKVLKQDFILNDKENIKALKVEDTYTFHPLKYIYFWKKYYQDLIYENSKVEKIEKENDYYKCYVNGYVIKAKYVIVASHYPYFFKKFLLPFKSYIETSYIGASKSVNKKINAINIDKPTISFRYYNNYLIYLENSYKSASVKDIEQNFNNLKKLKNLEYIWSNNDVITNDYLPLIGSINKDNSLFITTGYNTWGFTNSILASIVIRDIILKKDNPYINLFNPKRAFNLSKLVNMPTIIFNTGKAYIISNKNNVNNKEVINKVINGKKVLVYKDQNKKEHIVLNKCPHMKCGIVFNKVENIWECLCHGSKFDIDGKCINGPSNLDITFKD